MNKISIWLGKESSQMISLLDNTSMLQDKTIKYHLQNVLKCYQVWILVIR